MQLQIEQIAFKRNAMRWQVFSCNRLPCRVSSPSSAFAVSLESVHGCVCPMAFQCHRSAQYCCCRISVLLVSDFASIRPECLSSFHLWSRPSLCRQSFRPPSCCTHEWLGVVSLRPWHVCRFHCCPQREVGPICGFPAWDLWCAMHCIALPSAAAQCVISSSAHIAGPTIYGIASPIEYAHLEMNKRNDEVMCFLCCRWNPKRQYSMRNLRNNLCYDVNQSRNLCFWCPILQLSGIRSKWNIIISNCAICTVSGCELSIELSYAQQSYLKLNVDGHLYDDTWTQR